jgi:hypothetical protein
MIINYFLLLVSVSSLLIRENPFLLGTFVLRTTNDPSLINKFTTLILKDDGTLKVKTLAQNGIVATKISRSGTIKFQYNNKKSIKYYVSNLVNNKISEKYSLENDMNVEVNFNNVNKYSYSFFGIEVPEFRYEQITDFVTSKKVNVQQKENTLFIKDDVMNYYYLFDISYSDTKRPFIEMTLFTLFTTQIISSLINIIFIKNLN